MFPFIKDNLAELPDEVKQQVAAGFYAFESHAKKSLPGHQDIDQEAIFFTDACAKYQ